MRRIHGILASATALALATGLLASAPAHAIVAPEAPSTVPWKWPITVDASVPAGGSAWVGSPTLPTAAQRVDVIVSLAGGPDMAGAMFTALGGLSNKDMLLFCAALGTPVVVIGANPSGAYDDPDLAHLAAAVVRPVMQACFAMVQVLVSRSKSKTGADREMRAKCPLATVAIPVITTQGADGPLVQFNGTPTRPRKPPLKVTCRMSGDDMKIRVKTRSKRKTLAAIVGDRLTIGFQSLPGATSDAAVQLTFGVPR
ncbi:MAG: hypothetical protein Q7V58_06240 [Actinomycetota bacterium]|nr:hypothetical protein [Actinomycetota bacterium]